MATKVKMAGSGRAGVRQPGGPRVAASNGLENECPKCYAEPGEMCITPSGYEAKKIHKGRA